MKKKTLNLKKKIISSLSDAEKKEIIGGQQQVYTTSIQQCTGFTCCNTDAYCTTTTLEITTIGISALFCH